MASACWILVRTFGSWRLPIALAAGRPRNDARRFDGGHSSGRHRRLGKRGRPYASADGYARNFLTAQEAIEAVGNAAAVFRTASGRVALEQEAAPGGRSGFVEDLGQALASVSAWRRGRRISSTVSVSAQRFRLRARGQGVHRGRKSVRRPERIKSWAVFRSSIRRLYREQISRAPR